MDTQSLAQQLVRDWQKPIYNFALRWFGDENHAADATQETFLVALRDLHQLRSPSKLRSWIFTVARRVMIRQGKRSSPGTLLTEVPSNDGQQSEQAMEKERQERISAELAALPEELRTVLILHYFHDLSQVEMAEQLSIPRTTIQSQLKRGLERLRTKLVACGISYGVLELEQRFRSSPFAAVPDSLKAKLGSLATPTAVSVSALAAGGLIVKLKMMALGIITLSLGLGTWFLLPQEAQELDSDRRDNSPSQAYLDLEEENKALKKRLLDLERGVLKSQGKASPGAAKDSVELARLRNKLEEADAHRDLLSKQVSRLKAELPQDSPSKLVEEYVRLLAQSEEDMKGLEGAELSKRRRKVSKDMMPIVFKLMAKPLEVTEAVLDTLADPRQKRKKQLTTLISTLFVMKELSKEERAHFNSRVMELVNNKAVEKSVQEDLLGQLILKEEYEGQETITDSLMDIVRDREHRLREPALTKLASVPLQDCQSFIRALIEDQSETANMRTLAFVQSRAFEREGGEELCLRLMRENDKELRRAAYENADQTSQPSHLLRLALEDALQKEREVDLFGNILGSLETLGNQDSLAKLQVLIEDQGRPLELRSRAQKTLEAIRERMKKTE